MLIQKPQEITTGPNTVSPPFPRPPTSTDPAAITLVQCIIKQNSTLKDQINHIQAELDKGRHLSDRLLNQNKILRQVYTGRTTDITKLLKSMMIQKDEEKVDYEHQCHLIKELNFSTLREIKNLDQQRRQIDDRLGQKKRGIYILLEQKNVLENEELNILKARIKNGISPQATQKSKRIYEEQCQRNRKLEQEVNQLLILNTKIRGELKRLSNSGQLRRDAILLEKYECEQALAKLKQENKRYKDELAADKVELEKTQDGQRQKEQKYNDVLKGLNQQVKKYEKSQRIFNELTNDREKCKKGILISMQAQAHLSRELDKIRQHKEELEKQRRNLKRRMATQKEEWGQREEALRQDHRQNIIRITNQIAKQQNSFQQERTKITTQKSKVENQISLLESQYESLEERIGQYNRLIKERPNPILEIEKIQLSMRLKRR